MRREPQARGRCHDADYWELTQILSADVDRAHAVAVEDEAAALVRGSERRGPAPWSGRVRTAGRCGYLVNRDQ